MTKTLGITLLIAFAAGIAPLCFAGQPDDFSTISEMNKASLVMLSEKGIVPKPLASKIAKAIAQVIAEGDQPGAQRTADYLVVEKRLIELMGPDASRLHSGRSRQDMKSTTERMILRSALLTTFEDLN